MSHRAARSKSRASAIVAPWPAPLVSCIAESPPQGRRQYPSHSLVMTAVAVRDLLFISEPS